MNTIAYPADCRKGGGRRGVYAASFRPAEPPDSPSVRLQALAIDVLRLGRLGLSDPERFIIAKETIAAELRQVAREIGP